MKELHNIDWDDDCYESDFYLSIPKVGQERLVFQMSLVEPVAGRLTDAAVKLCVLILFSAICTEIRQSFDGFADLG